MADLSGKVAFVTTATGSISQACLKKLAEAGAKVCLARCHEHDPDGGDLSVSVVPNEPSSWDEAFEVCTNQLGGLDILVIPTSGAASSPIEDLTLTDFVTTHREMVVPAFLAQNRGILAMRSAGNGGTVIHVLPAASRAGLDGAVAACTAGAGILYSSKSAALECAKAEDGIVVNSVLVGAVEGEPELRYPDGSGPISPDAIAESVLFYAADGAAYMTGMDLPVDDGFLAG